MFRVRLTRKEFEGLPEFKFHRGPAGLRIADEEFHDASIAFYFVSTTTPKQMKSRNYKLNTYCFHTTIMITLVL